MVDPISVGLCIALSGCILGIVVSSLGLAFSAGGPYDGGPLTWGVVGAIAVIATGVVVALVGAMVMAVIQ